MHSWVPKPKLRDYTLILRLSFSKDGAKVQKRRTSANGANGAFELRTKKLTGNPFGEPVNKGETQC